MGLLPGGVNRPAMGHKFILTLTIGVSTGFSFAYILLISSEYTSRSNWISPNGNCHPGPGGADPHHSLDLLDAAGPSHAVGKHGADEEFHRWEDHSVAEALKQKVRVLCWVMTNPDNHERKAKHVKMTWGQRCNVILFMSSAKDDDLPTIVLPVNEGRNNLWAKTKEAFKYVYEHHRNDADWFLKADDDTYVVVENLRYMLAPQDSGEPVYFGCRFKPFVKQGYMSGGAGYVLSRAALDAFVTRGLSKPELCRPDNDGSEDVEMGKCLENVGVKAGDSRDSMGRGRFFPFVPEHHLIPGHVNEDFWYWKYIYYKTDEGLDCCSDNAVSFHYVSPNQMYVLDYLIYHLKPFGINYNMQMPLVNGDASKETKGPSTAPNVTSKKDGVVSQTSSQVITAANNANTAR